MMRLGRSTATLIALVVFATVLSACNSKLLRPPAIVFADSGEYGVKTSVRENDRSFPSVFTAFLPSQVPLHPGDALNFQLRDTGEPHSVALGTLITEAVDAVEVLGPSATLKQIEALAAMKRVPSVLPTAPASGTPELAAAAAERCFLEDRSVTLTGKAAQPCPETDQPEFNGRQAFFSSGVLEEGEPFRLKLDDETAPGTYRFMCLVHRSAMTGAIEVRPKDTDRPPVAELRTQAEAEEGEVASSLEPAARDTATAAKRAGGPVAAGAGPEGLSRGFLSWFFDRDVRTTVGTPLRWTFHQAHTVSFSPSREAKEGFVIEDGDGVKLNPAAWAPVGSRPPPDDLVRPVPPKKAYAIHGGTWSGEGEWSSGVIRATPPTKVTYAMRFGKAGTYRYQCLIHQAMRGTVVVE